MFAQPSPCMHAMCVPGASTSFRCTWKSRSESSSIAATGSYPWVAHQPVSTAAPSTSASSPIASSTSLGVLSGWFSSPKRTPCARSTATAPSRSRRTTSPTPPIRSTSRSFARRQAAARSSVVAPMLPARLTTRTPRRASASRASATCSGVAQRQLRWPNHRSMASNPIPVIVASRSSKRVAKVSIGSNAAFVASSNGPHSVAAP